MNGSLFMHDYTVPLILSLPFLNFTISSPCSNLFPTEPAEIITASYPPEIDRLIHSHQFRFKDLSHHFPHRIDFHEQDTKCSGHTGINIGIMLSSEGWKNAEARSPLPCFVHPEPYLHSKEYSFSVMLPHMKNDSDSWRALICEQFSDMA
jgi:hypothetical protein